MLQPGELLLYTVRTEFPENVELSPTRGFCPPIGQVDDHALVNAVDCSVRLVDKTLQPFRQPVIAPGFAAIAVHALLNNDPMPVVCDDEAVQIEVEPILERCTVDLCDKPACRGERGAVQTDPLADRDKLMRRLTRVVATPTADMDTEFAGQGGTGRASARR